MPHIREATEVRFYAPDEIPARAAVLEDVDAAHWRKHLSDGVGERPGWLAQYGPTNLRTVAARVYAIYCECKDCRNWRDCGRPDSK